jgi:hypothetical protein
MNRASDDAVQAPPTLKLSWRPPRSGAVSNSIRGWRAECRVSYLLGWGVLQEIFGFTPT